MRIQKILIVLVAAIASAACYSYYDRGGSLDFESYPRYDEIKAYLQSQARAYPEFLSLSNEGTTDEGRDLILLTFKAPGGDDNRKAIWVDSGIHAREWIALSSGLYLVDKLVSEFAKGDDDPSRDNDITSVDWYVMPLLNPDGYEYSHTNDRHWRKNRAVSKVDWSPCRGVDLNRNYDVDGYGVGGSKDPCEPSYIGESPNSEPEVKAASRIVLAHKEDLKASISLHSAGALILTSWGYKTDLPDDNDELVRVADAAAKAVKKVNGRSYKVEPAAGLYPAGGASDDFAKANGIPFSTTIELPGAKGKHGLEHFENPESDIKPIGEETWEMVKSIARET